MRLTLHMVVCLASQLPGGYDPIDGTGPGLVETNVDYLSKHAEEWEPPRGNVHLHLMFNRRVYWQIVERSSRVCNVPGRCHLIRIRRQ